MKITVKTRMPEARAFLELCVDPTMRALQAIKDSLEVEMPAEVFLRPLKNLQIPNRRRITYGRGGKGATGDYYISLNLRQHRQLDACCLDTIAHKAAHVAAVFLCDEITHGDVFCSLYETTRREIC